FPPSADLVRYSLSGSLDITEGSVPLIGLPYPGLKGDARPPTKRRQFGNVEQFAGSSIRFRGVENELSGETNDSGDQLVELDYGHIRAGSDVDRLLFRPGFHQEDHCVGQVVDMQKLTTRATAAPNFHCISTVPHGGINLGEQRWQNM